ncbi:hypothetical protein Plhal304r1_c009g0036941 [Plasmopara halstedii]
MSFSTRVLKMLMSSSTSSPSLILPSTKNVTACQDFVPKCDSRQDHALFALYQKKLQILHCKAGDRHGQCSVLLNIKWCGAVAKSKAMR